MPDVPWLAMGDFNMIRSMEERSDFFMRMPCPSPTLEFQNFLYDIEFLDLHHDGPTFT